MTSAKTGDTVSIDFVVQKADGTVVGNTEQSGPQTVTLGQNQIFPQVEEALQGMSVGEEKKVAVDSDKGFGPRRDELVIDIPRANLPADPAPQPGMGLQAQNQQGQPINLVIIEVGEESVKADGNHPLAGEDLVFDVTLREIKDAA
ncbi:FKBP-type peptidyl-prolyl cis-trans isomerase [Sphingomicrobium sediminis]|uniref:Peptidyl-prolyl cis-trans isomerase n=1 Tax=Sphingomicrobium sediminis TaxID=2950949 RepID=A0A9X2EFF3_9SPHN|nr:FKBP-type peptidyl-prolyl cis-trans isomerase [Sphingomicrobium sediminis]MCM8556980.1 FKBP-type peptidyl-prolyl cis-trans isomerase [Sphingomicrobium sediminis]